MSPLPRQGWLFLIAFLKWYFSKYWQVRTRPVFAQTVTYYISPHCPLLYCLPQSSQLNFFTSNSQCQFNRDGLLCGQCQQVLSTVFGYSHCQHCSNIYLLLIITYIGEIRLSFACKKIHEVTPTRFFDIIAFFISYLLNGWIDLFIVYSTQSRQTQLTCDQV